MTNKITKLMLDWEEYLIREYQAWWQPWANTVAYYPLDATNQLNDLSWNGYTLTDNAGYTFWTYQWVSCVYMTWNYSHLNSSTVPVWNTRTVLARIYCTRANYNQQWVVCTWSSYQTDIIWMWVYQNKGYVTDWYTGDTYWTTNIINGRHLLAFTWTSWGWIKLYVDWVLDTTSPIYTRSTWTWFTIGSKTYSDPWSAWSQPYQWYISNVIYEDKIWTADEIQAYFNQTKSLYGIS